MTICRVRGIGKLRKTVFFIKALKVTNDYISTRTVYGMGIGNQTEGVVRWEDFIFETPDGIYEITPLTKEEQDNLPKDALIAGT